MNQLKTQQVDTLNIATDTLEYRLRGVRAPVAESLTGCFAVVQRPADQNEKDHDPEGHQAVVELLTVSPDNQLLHVRRSQESDTGWMAEKVKMPGVRQDGQTISGRIQQIEAFYQGKCIYAMVHYAGKGDFQVVVAMKYQAGKGWSELRLKGDVANALYSTRQTAVYRTPNGYHFFYGVSTAYERPQLFVVFETGTSGVWAAVNEAVTDADATYRLLPGSSTDRYGHTLLEMTGNGINSRQFFLDEDDDGYFLEWGEKLVSAELPGGSLSAANVHAFPSRLGSNSLLLHTDDNQLHYVAGYLKNQLRHTQLTGGNNQPAGLENICIGRDRFDRATVFATSARDRRLWVLRQTAVDDNKDLVFADWVCLGNMAAVIGCPRAMLDGAELFLVDANTRDLIHMRQNDETTIWHSNKIQVAAADNITATQTTVHGVDVLAEDANGAPVGFAALELQSEVACDVAINGVVRQLTSETWVRANADVGGKLSLTMAADSLTAPNLKIRVGSNGKIFSANPDAKVAGRLQGKDPRVKFEVMEMRKAGLLPTDVQGEAATNVVSLVKEIGKAAEQADNSGTPRSGNGKARRFTVESGNQGVHAVKRSEVVSSEVHQAGQYVGEMPRSAPTTAADPLSQLVGDVINWVEHAWEEVSKFVVTAAEGVVHLAFTIGGKVRDLIVDTAEGIARAFESVFQGIADLFRKAGEAIVDIVEKIVKFVQALFGWEDILVTNDMLQLAINDTLDSAEEFFSVEGVAWIQHKVDGLKQGVDQVFDQLEEAIGPVDPQAQERKNSQDSLGGKMGDSMQENRVSTDLVQNQTQRNPEEMEGPTKTAAAGEQDPMKAFTTAIEASYKKNIEGNLMRAGENFKPQSIDEVFSQGLNTVVKAIRPLLHFAIDIGGEILQMGLRAVGAVLKALKKVFNTTLEIPIVSDFFQEHAGRPLKIMDIGTLLIAAPMTIIYKLVFGGKDLNAPFSNKNVTDIKRADFSWGQLMTALSVVASGGDSAPKEDKSLSSAEHVPVGGVVTYKLAVALLRLAEPLLKPLIGVFTLIGGFFSFLYGWIAGWKHMADTKDITGKASIAARVIGYIGKFIDFALGVPSLVVSVVAGINMFEEATGMREAEEPPEDEKDQPFTLPLVMSLAGGIFALVGLGLMFFDASMVVTRIADLIAGIILAVVGIYTFIAVIQIGVATQDGVLATREGLNELASLMGAIPGLFAWMVLAALFLNTTGQVVAGETMVIILVAVEVVCASVAGLTTIISLALPGLFNPGERII